MMIDAATVARLAHISDEEILQDIADTEREIAEVIMLAPMVGEEYRNRHLAVNEQRKEFVAKLRELLEARAKAKP